MNVLDSPPLEALAFNYLSFGLFTVVNNLWTWVAVLTAAVSFWSLRLRADSGAAIRAVSSSCLKYQSPPSSYDQSSNGSSPVSEATPSKAVEEEEQPSSVPALAKFEDDGVLTKGLKFTLYYQHNGEVDGDDVAVEEDMEESGCGDEVVAEGCGDWWESVLRLRTGEMGWYRHLELTELNGNVVRLWDGYRVREESYSSSKCCVVW